MSNVKVTSNFALKGRQFRSYAKRLGSKIMRDAMFMALEMVGITAVSEHMKQTSIDNFNQALSGQTLRIRSGRLSRSIMGIMTFTTAKYPSSMKKFVTANIPTSTEGWEGGKKESIRQVIINSSRIEGIIGSLTPYAAIHEFGGKAGRNLSVIIPKRPYLTPAVKETLPDIHDMFSELIHSNFKKENI